MVEVTQADRDAVQAFHRVMAEKLFADIASDEPPTFGDDSGHDGDAIHQAFADHREAALTTAQAEAEALKQRIAVLEKVIREVGRKAWCNPDSLTCQEIEALVVPLLSENGNG